MFHPEKNLTSVLDRYKNEIKRVSGVIDAHLKKQGTAYLLSDSVKFMDLAFIPWFKIAGSLMADWDYKTELPNFAKWNESLSTRPAVTKVYAKEVFQKH
jgi:glutathione S-transferase